MTPYVLTRNAIDDLRTIDDYLRSSGQTLLADKTEADIFQALDLLSAFPGIGHRRPDLTPKAYYFLTVDPYLIAHRRGNPIEVLAVIHTSRNIRKLIASRR